VNPWEYVRRYAERPARYVIGLMSGTSVDGVDAALVRVSGSRRETVAELLHFVTYPFPEALRQRVLDVSHGTGNAEEVSRLNVGLGHLFADAAEAVLTASGISRALLDIVASHGQTVSHTPDDAATLQIGDAAVIAQRLGVPVVSDFRAADRAAGGQGAPLVPYADWCLLTHPTKSRAIQNIGGIGNVTYLPANATPQQVLGFDTGPGNMLIDRAVGYISDGTETFDRDGCYSALGTVQTDVLETLLNDPFLLAKPPKSAGREQFGEKYFQQLILGQKMTAPWLLPDPPYDAVATLTAFTAFSIVDAYQRFLPAMPDEVIVGGGGTRNPTLMRMLSERLSPIPVLTHEDVGINSDAKEAIAFAILANETMLGNPSNLPSVTGAKRPVIQGKIALP
jgi:anhydro-N-acetylmuramic acid kinase